MKILGHWAARKPSRQPDSSNGSRPQKQSAPHGTFGKTSQGARTNANGSGGSFAADLAERQKQPANQGAVWARDYMGKTRTSQPQPASPTFERPPQRVWDLDVGDPNGKYIGQPGPAPTPLKKAKPEEASPAAAGKTRLLGFDKSDGTSVDVFDQPSAVPGGPSLFPVGWLIVTEGPGRGNGFTLSAGLSQIGRNEDQAVALNFGDMAVSRSNHAAIVFDNDTGKFMIGHGGKANIVRLNGTPVIANEEAKDGDVITIGETKLVLKTFCGPEFGWNEKEPEVEEIPSIV